MSILAQGQTNYTKLEEEEGFSNAFRTSDLLLLSGRDASSKPWYRRPLFLWLGGITLAGLVIGLIVWASVGTNSYEAALFSPECLLPLGGGFVNLGGSMKSMVTNSSWCDHQVRLYFNKKSGYYYREVDAVAKTALNYFSALAKTTPPSPDQVIIFDIDETALSNAVEWMGRKSLKQPLHPSFFHSTRDRLMLQHHDQTGQTIAADILGTANTSSNKHDYQDSVLEDEAGAGETIISILGVSQLKGANSADRPALEPIRHLYVWLYNRNYSVAFITGRKESSRVSTALNLANAGFGKMCPTPEGANASTPTSGRTSEPCYVALHLRQEVDDRLASVFKPERRKQFMDLGFKLVGNFGDQFSDIEGLWHATASWKLPNPVYYIM